MLFRKPWSVSVGSAGAQAHRVASASETVLIAALKSEGTFDNAVDPMELDLIAAYAHEDTSALIGVVVEETHRPIWADFPASDDTTLSHAVSGSRHSACSVVHVDVVVSMREVDGRVRDDSRRRLCVGDRHLRMDKQGCEREGACHESQHGAVRTS